MSAKGEKFTALEIVEVGLVVGLALLLSVFKFLPMPQGGSVSLEMVPIFFIASRRGLKIGIVAGAILGLLKLLVEPFIVHPVQLVMDYPLAFALIGLAGLAKGGTLPKMLGGIALGSLGRFISHVLSGVIFFASYAPEGTNVWIYSLGYNASYMVPEAIVCLILVPILIKIIPPLPRSREAGA